MSGPIRCAVIAGAVGAGALGCGDDSSMTAADAAVVGGGLVLSWSSDPESWPGEIGDGLTVERATLVFDNLRLVGDAAPGDPRTTKSDFLLQWDDESQPADLDFPDAPGGVYSQLSLLIDGRVAGPSIELRGHVRVEGTDYEYRITDDSPFAVTLQIDKTLRPPAVTTLGLRIDFETVVGAIDFAALDEEGGRLELDNADAQIATFRTALMQNIQIVE